MIKAIVAVANDWSIGKSGKMLFHLPKDLKFFQTATKDHVVVCGGKTLQSLPGNKPLKDRSTICICTKENNRDDCFCINDFDKAIALVKELNKTQDVWIIGGQLIYEKFINLCEDVWVTKIDTIGNGDTYFPNLDSRNDFELVWEAEPEDDNGYSIKFCEYRRVYE